MLVINTLHRWVDAASMVQNLQHAMEEMENAQQKERQMLSHHTQVNLSRLIMLSYVVPPLHSFTYPAHPYTSVTDRLSCMYCKGV